MMKKMLALASIGAALCAGIALSRAQETNPDAETKAQAKIEANSKATIDENFEVLTRGPVH